MPQLGAPGDYGNVNDYFWIPIVGPFLGGVIGAFVYDILIRDTLGSRGGEAAEPEVGRAGEET